MDILVHIPHEREDYVWGTKLQPKRFNRGYWTLPGKPRFAARNDRIWFCNLDGLVVASARIITIGYGIPDDATSAPDATEAELQERSHQPAVVFDITTMRRYDFPMPRDIQNGFRGFRYVQPVRQRKRIVGLDSVHMLRGVPQTIRIACGRRNRAHRARKKK